MFRRRTIKQKPLLRRSLECWDAENFTVCPTLSPLTRNRKYEANSLNADPENYECIQYSWSEYDSLRHLNRVSVGIEVGLDWNIRIKFVWSLNEILETFLERRIYCNSRNISICSRRSVNFNTTVLQRFIYRSNLVWFEFFFIHNNFFIQGICGIYFKISYFWFWKSFYCP